MEQIDLVQLFPGDGGEHQVVNCILLKLNSFDIVAVFAENADALKYIHSLADSKLAEIGKKTERQNVENGCAFMIIDDWIILNFYLSPRICLITYFLFQYSI